MAKSDLFNKIIPALIFFVVVVIISLFSKPKATPIVPVSTTPTIIDTTISIAYKGKLPCADCSGLDTELILKKSTIDSINGTFVMKETYLERTVDPIITEGNWKTIYSSSKGKPIVILEINPGPVDSIVYFEQLDENQIKMLDKNRNEIIAPDINLTLIKID